MFAFEQQRLAEDVSSDAAGLAASFSQTGPSQIGASPLDPSWSAELTATAVAEAACTPKGRRAAAARRLAETIERALVPRLAMAHGSGHGLPPRDARPELIAAIEPLVALLIRDDAVGVDTLLQGLRGSGAPLQAICLDLLAGAARRLGEMWEEDVCDFATVTIGLVLLQRAMHDLHPPAAQHTDPRREALLAAAPGEQHVFGLAMVGEFLRDAGWQVCDGVGASRAELVSLVRRRWFCLVALTASDETRLEPLAATIRALRTGSCHAGLGVIVGGRIFERQGGAVLRVGADAMSADARTAVAQAERLLARAG
jgi:methanogenic corrinoid protein MtbC1